MTTFIWKTGSSGDWGVADNWTASPSGFPNASDAVVSIDASGTYTVTIPGGDSYTAGSVTLDSSGAVLDVAGTLTLDGTLTATLGAFDLSGELIGGTVAATGGTLTIENGATLDGVTWQAPLTLASGVGLYVTNGLTVQTAAGATPGSIDMTAGGSSIFVLGSETLDNATLNFGSIGGNALSNDDSSGGTLTLGNLFTIDQSGGDDTLSNTFANDTIANAGSIDVTGGELTVSGGSFTNNANIAISGGGSVDLSRTALTNSQLISIGTGSELVLGTGFVNTGTVTVASGATLDLTGSVTLEELALGTITNTGGTVLIDANGTLTIDTTYTIDQSGGPEAIVNDGRIDVTGGDVTVTDGSFTNSGTIAVSGGYVDLDTTTLTSSGAILIGNGSTFEIAPATAANVTYSDPATLILDNPTAYTGTLSGLTAGDMLQLDGLDIASAGILGTTLTVSLSGGGALTYQTGPGLSGTTFSVSQGSDGSPRDLLTALCFLAGTLIATPAGETRVEALSVGDMVCTASGAVRPIAWIGTGAVLATPGRRDAATPVVVSRGALGRHVPYHDLRVTKGHSFYVDGVLIPVEFLVNHRTIYWDDRAQEVALYHIELETHDVLLANGAPAESYRDDGNRWLFRNANSGWHLPPKPPCAPVLTGGPAVDAAWRRLLDRAGPRPLLPTTDDPDLHLLVDGRRMDATRVRGMVHSFLLRARPESVRIVSRTGVPQELGTVRDPRPLGVALQQIVLIRGGRMRSVGADSTLLTQGFHDYEPDDGIRWTNGDAALPASLFDDATGPTELALRLGGTTSYLVEGDLRRAG
jgi:hypothetical protein